MIKNYALILEQKKFSQINEDATTPGPGTDNTPYTPPSDDTPAPVKNQPSDDIPYTEPASTSATPAAASTTPAAASTSATPAASTTTPDPNALVSVANTILVSNPPSSDALTFQKAIGAAVAAKTITAATQVDGVAFHDSQGNRDLQASIKVTPETTGGKNWLHLEVLSVTLAPGQSASIAGLKGLIGLKANPNVVSGQVMALQAILNYLDPSGQLKTDGRYGDKTANEIAKLLGIADGHTFDQAAMDALSKKMAAAGFDPTKDPVISGYLSGKTAVPAQTTGQPAQQGTSSPSSGVATVTPQDATAMAKVMHDNVLNTTTFNDMGTTNTFWEILDGKHGGKPVKTQADMAAFIAAYAQIDKAGFAAQLNAKSVINKAVISQQLKARNLTIPGFNYQPVGGPVAAQTTTQTPAAPAQQSKSAPINFGNGPVTH